MRALCAGPHPARPLPCSPTPPPGPLPPQARFGQRSFLSDVQKHFRATIDALPADARGAFLRLGKPAGAAPRAAKTAADALVQEARGLGGTKASRWTALPGAQALLRGLWHDLHIDIAGGARAAPVLTKEWMGKNVLRLIEASYHFERRKEGERHLFPRAARAARRRRQER
jgi:hypothetical protein